MYLKYCYDRKLKRDKKQDEVLAKIRKECPSVKLEFENLVDFEPLIINFTYLSKSIVSDKITIADAQSSECCKCVDNCQEDLKCCSNRDNGSLAYDVNKCLKPNFRNTLIFECNQLCKCGPDCVNRVVQLGSNIPLCLFKTPNGKGWGLKSIIAINRGQFINEYVGEIIDFYTTERRSATIYRGSDTHYVFELKYYNLTEPYSIDATKYGNAIRFINHSCKPNCIALPVWYHSLDKNFPKLAFFALRDIQPNEEFTIDYAGGRGNRGKNIFIDDCKCETENCRRKIYV